VHSAQGRGRKGIDGVDFKVIEALRHLAYVLVIPLFAAAYLNDRQMLNEYYQLDREAVIEFMESSTLDRLLNSSDFRLWGLGWGVFIGIIMVMTGVVLIMAGVMIDLVDKYTQGVFSALLGIGCVLVGVLFFAGLAVGAPFAKLNPFWNLGLLSLGFILLDR
jgi:hypothetical protein